MDFVSLLVIALAFFVVAVTPGPANISNAIIAMSMGRATSLIYGAGLSAGLVIWGIVAASGLGAVLQSSVYLLTILKLLGGLYLLWLAYSTARTSFRLEEQHQRPISAEMEATKWFFRGFVLNISNPKTVIAWLAALSVGLDSGDGISALLVAVVVCVVVGFATNAMYSLVFSVRGMMQIYQRISHWINRLAAAFFAIAGLGLIRSAFRSQ
jgi:threonine/homoserine/homoserine lactone efflux protein